MKINKDNKEIWVVISKEEYNTTEIGDDIILTIYKGVFGIEYYFIEKTTKLKVRLFLFY